MEQAVPFAGVKQMAGASFLQNFFNFDSLITTRVIKIVYMIGLVLIPLLLIGGVLATTLFALVAGAGVGVLAIGFVQLIVAVIASLLGILLLRVYCEFIMVVFKIDENLQGIRATSIAL